MWWAVVAGVSHGMANSRLLDCCARSADRSDDLVELAPPDTRRASDDEGCVEATALEVELSRVFTEFP